ncbi:cleavage and polyadenylation specificity factor subunit 6-like [Chironomus tepperi]|uniref:cleavage and polyadenylation specificity factor subunit 6-like n=1 Tax=Chironomus tepperi TaxID=113505 RepID=UPI00391F08E6
MGVNVEIDLLFEDYQNEDQKDNYGQEDDLYDDVLTSGSNNLNSSDDNVSSDHAETGTNGIVMENLPKKELIGQTNNQIVTLPTKQALNEFECQQKIRPTPPIPSKGQKPMQVSPMGMNRYIPPQGGNMHPRMMRGPMPMRNSPMPMRMGGPNVPPPMNHPNGPQMNNMPPRFQNNWNNGPPRPENPGMQGNRPLPGMMNHQGQMINHQGPPMMNRPTMSGNRPFGPNRPMYPGNFNQGPQNMNNMGGRPRVQMNMGGPAPHVNPAFLNQGNQNPIQRPQGPHAHFNQQPRQQAMWPQRNKMPPAGPAQPPISESEFEEIMGRNRAVSSSAIARVVSDTAAGEYTSAMETIATAISLIKQSKVANDERCKILITSLQDTLQGIEAKSYNRRERSREKKRRRERSNSRSCKRSRSGDHRDHRNRGRGDDNSRKRPRKSPEPNAKAFKQSYDDRNREDRYREHDTRNRH